eukprot:308531_1
MQNTPWHYDDNVYKIYSMFPKLLDCYVKSQRMCQVYMRFNIMVLNDSIISDAIKIINNSIDDIYINGTQSLYHFVWFGELIMDLTLRSLQYKLYNDDEIYKKSNES